MFGMGKASRTKQEPDRRARIAAQREASARAEQRKRIYLAGGSILAVVIVVLAFVLVKLNSGGGSAGSASNGPTGTALTTVTKQVTDVPASVTDQVGAGTVSSADFVTGQRDPGRAARRSTPGYFATVNGKRAHLRRQAGGAVHRREYCPFCAAQRWAMVSALSRFGTFSGLKTIHSSSSDADPNTPTCIVLRLEVHEQVHHLHLRRGDHERAAGELQQQQRALRHAADPDVRPAGAA